MPYYRRGYRRRYRLGRRYRRRLFRRSYARRYVNGSSRSSIRMKCVVTASSTLHSGYGATLGSDVFSILPFGPVVGADNPFLGASPLYKAYVNLYEEVKLIGFKVQVSVTDQVGGSTLPSLQIYTAFDRRFGYTEATPTPTEIKNAATGNIATALNNNVAKISRSVYASDLIEKAQWVDSGLAAIGDANQAWVTASKNPNFFCPGFFMCFGSPALSQASEVANVHFSVSVTYYVAFRNPRFGGSSSSKDLPSKAVTFADDDDGDMEDDVMARFNRLKADLDRIEQYRNVEEPAGAARAAADMEVEPQPLGRRNRSNFSATNGLPAAKLPKN